MVCLNSESNFAALADHEASVAIVIRSKNNQFRLKLAA